MDIGNDGYDPNIELPLNQDTRVVVIVQDDNLTVELSGGVTFSHTRKISTNRYYGTIKFYAANPWNNVSNAKIKNLTYENLSLTNNEGLACTSGNCSSIYEKCRTQGAHVTSKEELEIWKEQNPDPPATYGITSTRRYDGVNLEHWVDGYGWHFDGCCGNDDRYYVCARSGNEIENSNNCVEGDTACIAKKFSSFADGDLIPPNTPSWSSGIIFEIEIFNRYFSSYVPPEIQESTPDSTNLFNFEKDVKCEDICDLGIQGNKNDSWLCKTSRPLSDLRCCKVDEGQWCPSAVSTVNSEYGMVTLESSGSNRCCCGEVTIEEDVIDTSVRKEDRLFSTDSTFQSIKNSESILQENSSREVIYLDGNNEPIITTSSLKTDPSSNNIIPNETTIDEDSNETSIDNNGNPSITKSSSQSVTPYSSQNVESPGGGLSYLLIFVLIFLVFYYLVK